MCEEDPGRPTGRLGPDPARRVCEDKGPVRPGPSASGGEGLGPARPVREDWGPGPALPPPQPRWPSSR